MKNPLLVQQAILRVDYGEHVTVHIDLVHHAIDVDEVHTRLIGQPVHVLHIGHRRGKAHQFIPPYLLTALL